MTPAIFDSRVCELGEGPLWHPERATLFWFDILGKRLLSRAGDTTAEWRFDRHVSAAGWVDRDRLLVASETGLDLFDLSDGTETPVCVLERDDAHTRSNDGRADPFGGFWIGTMGKGAEPGAGAIYRWYRGELRRLYGSITIPNAMCFTSDGRFGHFADTTERKVWRVALDPNHGWPLGAPEVYLDLGPVGRNPDGAVIDSTGMFWCAEWGSGAVRGYDPAGALRQEIPLPVPQPSCPAFGGAALDRLHITSATQDLTQQALVEAPLSGQVFQVAMPEPGQREHPVVL